MSKPVKLKAGQRVRILSNAKSEFAGYIGTVIYAGNSVYDVRIKYKPKGSKTCKVHIDSFRHDELESLSHKLDLATYAMDLGQKPKSRIRWMSFFGFVILFLVVLLLVFRIL